MLRDPRLFPCLILALNTCSMLRYALARDWPRVAYWAAAAALTYVTTFSLKSP